jgi:hypothetical protein
MSNNTPYVVKQVLKLYDIESVAFVNKKRNYISITVHVIFTPKKISSISPTNVKCYGVVNFYKRGNKLEEMMLNNESEMPILSYIDDKSSFYSFVEDKIRDVADKEYNSMDEMVRNSTDKEHDSLDKMIRKMILPKYPWIVDYEILSQVEEESVNSNIYYRVNYFIAPEWRKNNDDEVLLNDMKKVEDITKTLFKALGFDENIKFAGVDFYVNEQS